MYWEEHAEKPVPFFELSCSYIPLANMIWIPLMYVQLTPLKLQVELGYILKVREEWAGREERMVWQRTARQLTARGARRQNAANILARS